MAGRSITAPQTHPSRRPSSHTSYSLAPLIDDCKLLGILLDDCLKADVGTELFSKVERIRALAQCAADLALKHDAVSGR